MSNIRTEGTWRGDPRGLVAALTTLFRPHAFCPSCRPVSPQSDRIVTTGASGGLVLALLVLSGGPAAYLLDRHRSIPLRTRHFVGRVNESALSAAVVVSSLGEALFAAWTHALYDVMVVTGRLG